MLDTSRLDHLLCVCETIVSKSNNPFWISESFVDGLLHKEELAGFFLFRFRIVRPEASFCKSKDLVFLVVGALSVWLWKNV